MKTNKNTQPFIFIQKYVGRTKNLKIKRVLYTEAQNHCKGFVHTEYAEKVIRAADILLVAYKYDNPTIPVGFAVLEVSGDTIELQLICSNSNVKGVGTLLEKSTERLTKRQKKSVLKLDSLPNAETFYRKLGFIESDKPCMKSPVLKRSGSVMSGFRYSKCMKK